MLYLLLTYAGVSAAIAAPGVTEVIPRVQLRPLPGAAAVFAGGMDYRGAAVPVVDLNTLFGGAPCAPRLSTRIFVVRTTGEQAAGHCCTEAPPVIGFLAEGVSDALELQEADFLPASSSAAAGAFGRIARTPRGLLNCFTTADLLARLCAAVRENA